MHANCDLWFCLIRLCPSWILNASTVVEDANKGLVPSSANANVNANSNVNFPVALDWANSFSICRSRQMRTRTRRKLCRRECRAGRCLECLQREFSGLTTRTFLASANMTAVVYMTLTWCSAGFQHAEYEYWPTYIQNINLIALVQENDSNKNGQVRSVGYWNWEKIQYYNPNPTSRK